MGAVKRTGTMPARWFLGLGLAFEFEEINLGRISASCPAQQGGSPMVCE